MLYLILIFWFDFQLDKGETVQIKQTPTKIETEKDDIKPAQAVFLSDKVEINPEAFIAAVLNLI